MPKELQREVGWCNHRRAAFDAPLAARTYTVRFPLTFSRTRVSTVV
ncbi:MAG: hypothetical protein ABSB36_12345 [Candidatus Dormibacteria bacterium]|jgi:hypothetical protein